MERTDTIKQKWADNLLNAKDSAQPTDNPAVSVGEVSLEEAYDIQAMLVENAIKKGEQIIGWKVGATSRSIMNQLKIDEPIFGCMTSGSYHPYLAEVKASNFCKLAVEGEIALVMGKNLCGPGITVADTIMAAAGVLGAVELVDCRIKDWRPTITEAVADNSLHAGVILGSLLIPLAGFDLKKEGVILKKNGCLLASACGIEALGDPINVVTWLANKLSDFDREIRQGEIILTGSLTEFFFLEPGDVVDVSFSNLGNIQFVVTP